MQFKSVVGACTDRPGGETKFVQRFVKQDTGMIAGERATRRIRTVLARGETDDQQARVRITERRHRFRKIFRVFYPDIVEEFGQPGTLAATGVETIGHAE